MLSLVNCAIITALVSVLYFLFKKRNHNGIYGLPPGPSGWPIVGSLGTLFGVQRHQKLASDGRKYGGIFTMHIGAVHSVWITSFKIFREAVVDNTWAFAGRPQHIWLTDETTEKNPGIIASGVDETARNVRKFTLVSLRSFGFGKTSMQDAILRESDDLIEEIRKQNGRPFNPRSVVANAAANVISSVAFARTYKQGDEALAVVNDSITNAMQHILKAQRDRIFPGLRFVPFIAKFRDSLNNSFSAGKRFLSGIVSEHVAEHEAGNPRDFVDMWLDENGKSEQSAESFPVSRLENVLLDLFAGGFETTTTTFQWIFALLLHHPEVQVKIHQELDSQIGQGQSVTLETRDLVPYTEAVILETLRMYPLIPFAVPHQATEDTTLAGYRIPKGTQVMLHLYSILHDPELWTDPETFCPERFLHDGLIKIPDYWVPFGMGRRSCIGEQLARKELFLIFANLMKSFRLVLPKGDSLPSLDLQQGVVIYPSPFKVVLVER
ncbi:Cytochrome P450 2J6 [Hypsibius exemplaris]|uniref:Cytochrome P450 2J6 n=1 Tax=Hypsibius exemplaris TaxID=2072580 RepID=A0A1W0WNG1_HYPEX|nr:Cytochrome P450 2J6 [Hypsibius exemplaris]